MAVSGQGALFFDRVTLKDVDFRKASFESFETSGCVFVGCDFRETVFDRRLAPLFAGHPRSIFRQCDFSGADLRRAVPGQSRFEECTFVDARLDEWSTVAAEFIECAFVRGIAMNRQLWPQGDRYVRLDRLQQRLTRGRTEILRWSDLEERGQALDLIQAASFLYRERNEIIARRAEPRSSVPVHIQERVWATLASIL